MQHGRASQARTASCRQRYRRFNYRPRVHAAIGITRTASNPVASGRGLMSHPTFAAEVSRKRADRHRRSGHARPAAAIVSTGGGRESQAACSEVPHAETVSDGTDQRSRRPRPEYRRDRLLPRRALHPTFRPRLHGACSREPRLNLADAATTTSMARCRGLHASHARHALFGDLAAHGCEHPQRGPGQCARTARSHHESVTLRVLRKRGLAERGTLP